MKISVEPTEGHTYNAETGKMEAMAGTRVVWQAKPGGKREHANIVMDSAEPAAMLEAAAAYFKSQEIPF